MGAYSWNSPARAPCAPQCCPVSNETTPTFPRRLRKVADLGASLIVWCANNMMPRQQAKTFKDLHNATRGDRCRETGLWLVSSDVTGERDGRVAWGPTAILNPEGEAVAQLALGEPGLLFFDILAGIDGSTGRRIAVASTGIPSLIVPLKWISSRLATNSKVGSCSLSSAVCLAVERRRLPALWHSGWMLSMCASIPSSKQIRASGVADGVGPAGYVVAYGIAGDNLILGRTVIADSVNPLHITRASWLSVAHAAGVKAVEVEVVCSDEAEHRKRVETRVTDVEGLVKPIWKEVSERAYDEWHGPIVIDTASTTVEAAVEELVGRLGGGVPEVA